MARSSHVLGPRTLLSLLIAVAIAACAPGFDRWSRRRGEWFLRLTRYHRMATFCVGDGLRFIADAHAYYKGLAAKYSPASRYPWLPVAADPLPPPLAFPAKVVNTWDDTLLIRP